MASPEGKNDDRMRNGGEKTKLSWWLKNDPICPGLTILVYRRPVFVVHIMYS